MIAADEEDSAEAVVTEEDSEAAEVAFKQAMDLLRR